MLVTIEWIRENYNIFNEKYFGGQLPKNLSFEISMSKKTWGYAKYRRQRTQNGTIITPLSITLSNYYDSSERVKLNTLLHEMVHIEDYTLNPQHFTSRGYDAHGPIFFLKEAQRLNQDGWDIQKYVAKWEEDESELSDTIKKRIEKKIGDGVEVIVNHHCKNGNSNTTTKGVSFEFSYKVVNPKQRNEIITYVRNLFGKGEIDYSESYLTKDSKILELRQIRRATVFYLNNNKEKLISEYKLVYNDIVVGERPNPNIEEIPSIENNTQQEPKEKTEFDIYVPKFQMMLPNGRMLFKTRTNLGELREFLKKSFPKASDEKINSILNNQEFFPNGIGDKLNEKTCMKRKIILNERQFKDYIKYTLSEEIDENDIIGTSSNEDPMVHVQRIGNDEEIVSIE